MHPHGRLQVLVVLMPHQGSMYITESSAMCSSAVCTRAKRYMYILIFIPLCLVAFHFVLCLVHVPRGGNMCSAGEKHCWTGKHCGVFTAVTIVMDITLIQHGEL